MELEKRSLEKLPILNYFRAMLDFGFFSFTIPFRLRWNKKDGYTMFTNRNHKIICFIIQMLVIYESVAWLCLIQRIVRINDNPYHYMRVAQLLKCTAFCTIFIYTFWFKNQKFALLIQRVQRLSFLYGTRRSNFKTLVLAYGICFLAMVWAAAEFCAINIGLIPLESGSGGRISMVVKEARHLYLFPSLSKSDSFYGNPTINGTLVEHEGTGIGLVDIVVTTLHVIAVLPHYICVNSADKIVLLLAIFCRYLVIDFVSYAKRSSEKLEEVFRNYEALKDQIRSINEVLGMLILFFVGGCLPFYPTWTGIIFFHKDASWFQYAQFTSFFGMFFLILCVGADINFKAGEFYVWISSKEILGEHVPASKINAIMIDMYSEQIALRGGGFFRMTYGFFGTVLSVIVTYTIIIVQFQISKGHTLREIV